MSSSSSSLPASSPVSSPRPYSAAAGSINDGVVEGVGVAGVVAFSAIADTEMGDYDESPTILFRFGQLPSPWNED